MVEIARRRGCYAIFHYPTYSASLVLVLLQSLAPVEPNPVALKSNVKPIVPLPKDKAPHSVAVHGVLCKYTLLCYLKINFMY